MDPNQPGSHVIELLKAVWARMTTEMTPLWRFVAEVWMFLRNFL
jgi:hypothetical protein